MLVPKWDKNPRAEVPTTEGLDVGLEGAREVCREENSKTHSSILQSPPRFQVYMTELTMIQNERAQMHIM